VVQKDYYAHCFANFIAYISFISIATIEWTKVKSVLTRGEPNLEAKQSMFPGLLGGLNVRFWME